MYRVAFAALLLCSPLSVAAELVIIYESETRVPVPNVAIYNNYRSKTTPSSQILTERQYLSEFSYWEERLTFKHIGYHTKRGTEDPFPEEGHTGFFQMAAPEQLDEVVLSISKWEQQKRNIRK